MKILESKKTIFKELEYGDVFRYYDVICMKIVQEEDEHPNAIDLETGAVYNYDDNECINPLPNAKLSLY